MTDKTAFEKIAAFNELIGNSAGAVEYVSQQFRMIEEEFRELATAILNNDAVGIRDGIADVLVTTYGLAHRMGIDADADLDEVYRSNMSKFLGSEDEAGREAERIADKLGMLTAFKETAPGVWAITSAVDQFGNDSREYPKGKLLKPSTYSEPVFK